MTAYGRLPAGGSASMAFPGGHGFYQAANGFAATRDAAGEAEIIDPRDESFPHEDDDALGRIGNHGAECAPMITSAVNAHAAHSARYAHGPNTSVEAGRRDNDSTNL